jgi:hypothetical protein
VRKPEQYYQDAVTWIEGAYNEQISKTWDIVHDFFMDRILTPVSESMRIAELELEVRLDIGAGVLQNTVPPDVIYNNKYYLEVLKESDIG